ncbi:hypothetical protein DID88_007055 [Monilinia fructigena]|uniref:Rrn9 domain-containing protein n=1 Tax=Monilinia fructigena TaxID=38457 RepID=A0A395J749_9HELO|nr:hypothetical protein DID88_007055 [Monilinia fructigena]
MLGLRDWSEVLGSAALVGFSPEVIARAAQRCANLFGEHMTMRTMVEGPVIGGKEDTIAEYYPGMIPDLGESDDSVSSFVENEKESSNSTSDPENVENEETLPMKHKIYYCSVGECHGNKVGFRTTARLLRHAQVDHNLSKSKPKALQIDSDEEMDGAVHNDRFLKPVTGKRGWRGTDKEKRKRRKSKVDRKEGSVLSDEGPGDENEHVDSYSESNSDSRLESESESELESEKQDGDNHEVGSNGRNGSVV